MGAIEQAEELRQQGIAVLITEREAIDAKLQLMGFGAEEEGPTKRRGRPKKYSQGTAANANGLAGHALLPE